jgi:hypothetical protein
MRIMRFPYFLDLMYYSLLSIRQILSHDEPLCREPEEAESAWGVLFPTRSDRK